MTLKIQDAGSKDYKLIETPYNSLEKAAKGQPKTSILTKLKPSLLSKLISKLIK